MFLIDNFEHEAEESCEYLVTILKLQAHVERFHVRKILQKVKISEKYMEHSFKLFFKVSRKSWINLMRYKLKKKSSLH